MKKPLFLLVAAILVMVHAHAQTSDRQAQTNGAHAQTNGAHSQTNAALAQTKSGLSLSLGAGLPLGEYGSKDANDPASGLAKLGALADLSYQHRFGKSNFGWMATLRYRFNGVDKNASIAPFAAEFPDFSWSMNHCRWSAAEALVGGYYERPLTRKLSLSASLELGVAQCWSPKETIQGVRDSVGFGPTDLIEANLHSVSATAFTALAGLSARYQWRDHWSFVARLNYSYLKPTFNNMIATVAEAHHLIIPGVLSLANAESFSVNSESRNYTQPMSSLDLVVGMCREF